MKIGLIREGKVPPDRRVPLTPAQCQKLLKRYSRLSITAQRSPIRCFTDTEYVAAGVPVAESVADCDVLLGVKEVPIEQLIPDKTYFFFSHTIKQQPYNQPLMRAILDERVTLVDYERLTDEAGVRLVGFGRWAGIVGAYNGVRGYGLREGLFELRPAHECFDMAEMEAEYAKVKLPPLRIVVTGGGRVSQGVREVLDAMGIRRVTAAEILEEGLEGPAYATLRSTDYHARRDGKPWRKADFYQNPDDFVSTFERYARVADMLIAAAYWDPAAPALFTPEDMLSPDFRLRFVADITCDIDGSIPTTRMPASISRPFYDYDPRTHQVEAPFSDPAHVSVMAVDNLPCELPRDASEDFGRQLIKHVIPALATGKASPIIKRATVTKGGALTSPYAYLDEYANAPGF